MCYRGGNVLRCNVLTCDVPHACDVLTGQAVASLVLATMRR